MADRALLLFLASVILVLPLFSGPSRTAMLLHLAANLALTWALLFLGDGAAAVGRLWWR